jgi:2-dehydro-3-deoxyphosphooctonate aldolase (KDO 8-P synthase)
MLRDPKKLLLIAGPCLLESRDLALRVAEVLQGIAEAEPDRLQVIFKGSFDKANRTSLESPRGPGLEAGLKILQEVGRETSLPTLTDFHLPEQAAPVGEVCSVLQVPAFLCRQTDLLVAAAQTGKVVNVKKGQFLSPAEMSFVVDKLEASGAAEIWLTERGSSFGYQNLVSDFRSIPILQGLGHPAIFDATHSLQLPGAAGGRSGGQRDFLPTLSRAAIAAGADGLFVETHPNPEDALSDAATQWPLDKLSAQVGTWLDLRDVVRRCG